MRHIKYIFLFFIILALQPANAQFWETTQGAADSSEVLNDCLLLPDASIIAVGYQTTQNRNLWLTKTNPNGIKLWERSLEIAGGNLTATSVALHPNGNLFVFGQHLASDGYDYGIIWEVNAGGNTVNVWPNIFQSCFINSGAIDDNGDIFVAGYIPEFQSADEFGLIGKFSPVAQDFEWVQIYDQSDELNRYEDLIVLSNGRLAATGYTAGDGQDFDVVLTMIDPDSTNRVDSIYGTTFPELAYGLTEKNDELFIVGSKKVTDSTGTDVFIMKTDLNGNELATWVDENNNTRVGRDIAVANDGNVWVVGEDLEQGADFQFLIQKFNASGQSVFDKQFGGLATDNGKAVAINNSNSIVAVGGTIPFNSVLPDGYIIHTDSLGTTFTGQVNGQVYWDENESCTNENELCLENWLVELQNGHSQWTTTDEQGNYSFNAGNGNYQVIAYPPNDYWNPCEISIPAVVQSQMDTIDLFHGIQSAVDCPLLIVDIGTSFLRRCFENTYQVKVCNQGTSIATAANTIVELDPSFNFISSTIPGTTVDNQNYDFDLGDIAPLECVEFQITILLDCDSTVIGQTHCVEAHAYPDSICNPLNALWDNSSIEVDAVCLGDSVEFIISNTGTGSTQSPLEYIITEDHIMLYQGGFDLDSGADTLIRVPASGGTLRMEADQAPGHPGISMPSVAVEGCGGFPFSLGFIIQYPHNDGNPFVDIDCRENVGSYDPNDKQAFPSGYRDEHFIEPNTQLEYLIRFQNTGTDTAFNVVIRDTLDTNLELSSISMGSASHTYRWSILGENILEVRFNNILLPDSTTNETGSHGFVKFTIDQKVDIPEETMIYNQAAIYFDFNPPIITNQTYHTIGIDYIIIDLVDGQKNPQEQATIIEFYPNPFLEHINFELINIPSGNLNFQLFNAQGQLIHVQKIISNRFSYIHKDRSPGVYFFQIIDDRQILKTGKIIHLN